MAKKSGARAPSLKKASGSAKIKNDVVHFIGVGGIGVSSLARWFLAQNWAVSGSDDVKSSITDDLKKDGVKIKIGLKKSNVPKAAQLVIHTVAIPSDNEELIEAKSRNIRVITYPQALGEFTGRYKTIAISGCHGKSTTTAIVAGILIEAKLDPTVVIGTKLNGSNFRAGKGKYLVIEADEYRGAFWNYLPYAALVNNIELDHVDFYKDLQAVKSSFLKFLNNVAADGFIVANGDDKNVKDVIGKLKKQKTISFGSADKAALAKIRKIIKVPGEHNVMNALGAYKLARGLGIKEETILKAIGKFKGVWRRSEYKGKSKEGWKIFDDYAHHPTAVKATLEGIRAKYPKDYLAAVFQPHQLLRFIALYNDFKKCFGAADKVILLDIYNPKGRDELDNKLSSKTLTEELNKKTPGIAIHSPDKDLKKTLSSELKNKKRVTVVVMGAGDVTDLIPKLLK